MHVHSKELSITKRLENAPLGYSVDEGETTFRLFAPRATLVELIIYEKFEDHEGRSFPLEKNEHGIWQTLIPDTFYGQWFAYKLEGRQDDLFFECTSYPIADPYSRHVTSVNHHLQFPKTKITTPHHFDWENDDFTPPKDPRDLVIYETHIKDLVAHPSAQTNVNGIYNDVREARVGGIHHLKELGVNSVEFLPLQKFGYFEPPFGEETEFGVKNTWNPYARNYWGYMTSFFLAPETIYASDGSLEPGAVIGKTDRAKTELKLLVRELHKQGIAVIMDVVYNHASHYDLNPLKYTAKNPYFRLDEGGNYLNDSWTGNDINTRSPQARQLIIESIKHWMMEYHIDGFRFDLAGILDWETVDLIQQEAQKIKPNVLLIAEPWGGEYKPQGFSDRGWSSWNDAYRNGLKGYHPIDHKGILFGETDPNKSRFAIENFIRGTLRSGEHGLFNSSAHSVNYLESHDGYTLGDFIRIALNPAYIDQTVTDKKDLTKLSAEEMDIARLAALLLFVSQGITMLHAGQEWARSKVIEDPHNLDPQKGRLDRDSYNKDDGTNWLNFEEIKENETLYNYYKGLIALRLASPALRKSLPEDINFKVYNDPLHITFSIDGKNTGDDYDYFVSLNANRQKAHSITLPDGYWEVVATREKSGVVTIKSIKGTTKIPQSSGIILRKLRVSKP